MYVDTSDLFATVTAQGGIAAPSDIFALVERANFFEYRSGMWLVERCATGVFLATYSAQTGNVLVSATFSTLNREG